MSRPVEGGVREATHHASLVALVVNLILREAFDARSGIGPFWEDQLMSSEVPIEIEDKQTAVSIMRELVEHLQDTMPATFRPQPGMCAASLCGERTADGPSSA